MIWRITLSFAVTSIFFYSCVANAIGTRSMLKMDSSAMYCHLSQGLSIDELLETANWQKWKGRPLKQISADSDLWLKLQIPLMDSAGCYLVSRNVNLDLLQAYVDSKEIARTGESEVHFSEFSSAYPNLYLEPELSGKEIHLRLRMVEGFVIPIEWQSTDAFNRMNFQRTLFSGLYMGVMSLMILINLLLFVSTKERIFIYYVLYVSVVALTQLSLFSDISMWLYPENLYLKAHDVYLFGSILGMCIVPFVSYLLDLKTKHKIYRFILNGFAVVYLVSLMAGSSSYLWLSMKLLEVLNLLGSVVLILMALSLWNKELKARYFLLAWGIFLVGSGVFILEHQSLLQLGQKGIWFMVGGNVFECVMFSVILGFHYNELKLNAKLKTKEVKAKQLTIEALRIQNIEKDLRSSTYQMKPHFLFNALTSLQHLIIKKKFDEGVQFIQEYAQLIRMTLEQSEFQSISLKDEVNFITKYMDVEQVREEFKFEIVVESSALERYSIPPMMIQPIIENSVKHAFTGKNVTGAISVVFDIDTGANIVVIIISDNGKGMRSKLGVKHQSIGLSNLRRRLKLINDQLGEEKAKLEIIETTVSGTKVKLTLPLTRAYAY